jgi:outer membrane protein OmpU
MKKVLIASTALTLIGGAAMADVLISGSGRAGLVYTENNAPAADTVVSYRLRFNIDASKETDAGVKFGGRIRIQNGSNTSGGGNGATNYSGAYVYAESSGFRVEVGNSNTAYDSAALMYNSEIGFLDRSFGDPQGSYYSFSSGPVSTGYVGVYVSYSAGDFNVQGSAVEPDQTGANLSAPTETEFGMSASYKFSGFTVSGAFVNNGAGNNNNDHYFLGGEYAINSNANVGLQYFDNGDNNPGVTGLDAGQQWTLYGNYGLANGVTLAGYIANNNELGKAAAGGTDSTVYGFGASYDIGGATVAGAIHSNYSGDITADVGVKFSF